MSQSLIALRTRIGRTKDIEKRIDLQRKLILDLTDHSMADAEHEATAMLHQYTSISHGYGIATAQILLGRLSCLKGVPTDGIKWFSIAREFDHVEIHSESLVGLGIAQRALGNYREAISFTSQAIGFLEGTTGTDRLYVRALNSLTYSFMHLSDYKTALMYGQEGMKRSQLLNDPAVESALMIAVASTYSYLGRYSEAQSLVEKSLSINRQLEEYGSVAAGLQSLVLYHSALKEWDTALPHALESFELADRIGYVGQKMRAALSLA